MDNDLIDNDISLLGENEVSCQNKTRPRSQRLIQQHHAGINFFYFYLSAIALYDGQTAPAAPQRADHRYE